MIKGWTATSGDVKDFNLIAADAVAITTSCNHVVYITEKYEIVIVGRVGMIYISLSIVTLNFYANDYLSP